VAHDGCRNPSVSSSPQEALQEPRVVGSVGRLFFILMVGSGEVNMSFEVQSKQCATCIYGPQSASFNTVKELEAEIVDRRGFFTSFRMCHHSGTACCRVFWDRHKDDFQAGQIAQRFDLVVFVEHDDGPGSLTKIAEA
jgi:hypothetical protein